MTKINFLAIFLLFLSTQNAPSSTKQAFVLAGQSNMVRNSANLTSAIKTTYGNDAQVIPVAVNGTSITEWQKGQPAYQNAVRAVQQVRARGYVVRAILIQHGETDALEGKDPLQYAALFEKFVRDFRLDCGSADIPVIFAQLGRVPASSWPGWKIIRQEQAAMRNRPGYRMISLVDIGPYEQGPHYKNNILDPSWAGTGYKEITQRFINTLRAVVLP